MTDKIKMATDAVMVDIDKVIPYHNNIKKHPQSQVDLLASMIAEYGWDQAIVTDKDFIIIKGHGRLAAAQKLNLQQVPVVVRSDLTPAQCKAARIADNKVAESEWDLDNLKIEFDELADLDFDLDLTGFDEDFFSNLDDNEKDENEYTKKIEIPIYEPKGEKPELSELFNIDKSQSLISEIDNSEIPGEIKEFLRLASYRHIIFNYQNIAEYYAHASPDIQNLMERSALVIIDFEKAIENGFLALSDDLIKAYNDNPA